MKIDKYEISITIHATDGTQPVSHSLAWVGPSVADPAKLADHVAASLKARLELVAGFGPETVKAELQELRNQLASTQRKLEAALAASQKPAMTATTEIIPEYAQEKPRARGRH